MKKLILILTLLISTNSFSQEEEEPNLQELMAQMGGHAQMILNGILYEDFEMIQESVAWVNDHPEPTKDLATIKEELGLQALRFKKYDNDAHDAANAIGAAAKEKDMLKIGREYGKMIKSCTKCHNAFRERLKVVLHP